MLYEYTSANNGAVKVWGDNNPWWNISTGIVRSSWASFLPSSGPGGRHLLARKKFPIPESGNRSKRIRPLWYHELC